MKPIYYLLAIAIAMSSSSCNKFLDAPQPEDTLSPDVYYDTAAQLDFALRGVYDILQSPELYKTDFHYLKGWEADEGYARANNFTTYLNSNEFTASSGEVFNYWRDLYKGISRANYLIANVNKNTSLDQGLRDRVRGEALFLRGYYYFLLVQSWGGVPLVTQPTTSIENTDLAKSTDVEVYQQIVKDMTEAEALVPTIKALGFGGRINKSAVRGILARVNLQWAGKPINDESKYAEARKWAKMVIDDAAAGHALNPSYSDIFIKIAQDKYDIKESIWEVEFSGNGVGTYAADGGNIGYNTGAAQVAPTAGTPNLYGTAPAYIHVTANLYHSYLPGDLRRGWNVQNYTLNAGTGARAFRALPANEAAIYAFPTAKWRREYELVERVATFTPQNFAILRYADVLLMFAEAENAVNGAPTPAAENAVNLVRRRAYAIGGIKAFTITNGGTGYTSAPTVNITGGGGTGGATATATVSAGRVTAITLTRSHVTEWNYGTYTSAPTISFSGGGGTGATATATLFTTVDADMPANLSKGNFLKFIQDERRRELCFESLRKFDLLRWGIYVSTMQSAGDDAAADNAPAHLPRWYRFVTDKHVLLPIPASDLTANKLLVQNPGWN